MPLQDHFHGALAYYPWEGLHSGWGSSLATHLVERRLPRPYFAVEHVHHGPSIEIDVATLETLTGDSRPLGNGPVATLPRVWQAPAPVATQSLTFPDSFEVRIYAVDGGLRLVGAIEFVSPGNKDREGKKRGFLMKCAGYLHEGVSLVILDVITNGRANLHNELCDLLGLTGAARLPDEAHLYASAFRPFTREEQGFVDVWVERCQIGAEIPTMPLNLRPDLVIPIEFELTYMDLCRRRHLI